jgi:hypothetical protein
MDLHLRRALWHEHSKKAMVQAVDEWNLLKPEAFAGNGADD